ncbi:hypothetical protein TNCV_3909891 [Trichonephila clavipes]|nr:hypothetical protein TNCV_3909891 [Trichonephila clavipes]
MLVDSWYGCGTLGVKITDSGQACHEFEPSITENPLCRGGQPMQVEFVVSLEYVLPLYARAPCRVITSLSPPQFEKRWAKNSGIVDVEDLSSEDDDFDSSHRKRPYHQQIAMDSRGKKHD